MGRKNIIGYVLIPEGESKESRKEYYKELIAELRRKGCRKVICEKMMSLEETEEIHMSYDGTVFNINEFEDKYIMRQRYLLEEINKSGKDDVLMVWSLDFLTTSTSGVIRTLRILGERKVGFRSIKDSIDTTRLNDETIPNLFNALDGFRKKQIGKNIKRGMWKAKAKGRKIGRPTIETKEPEKIAKVRKLTRAGMNTRIACQDAGLSYRTWCNHVNREKSQQKTT